MRNGCGWLLAAALLAGPAGTGAAADREEGEKRRGVLQAQRAGWMLGLYVGEGNGPYPFILEIAPASEAKLKGIRVGDELIRVDEEEAAPLARLFDRVKKLRVGREVTLWVRRGAQTHRFQVRVPERPDAAREPKEGKAASSAERSDPEQGEEPKKKPKRKRPVVIKPIPAPDP